MYVCCIDILNGTHTPPDDKNIGLHETLSCGSHRGFEKALYVHRPVPVAVGDEDLMRPSLRSGVTVSLSMYRTRPMTTEPENAGEPTPYTTSLMHRIPIHRTLSATKTTAVTYPEPSFPV